MFHSLWLGNGGFAYVIQGYFIGIGQSYNGYKDKNYALWNMGLWDFILYDGNSNYEQNAS